LDFALFLLVNAMLFIRPAEFHPALLGLPVYEVCILSCLAVSYPKVLARISPRAMAARPVDACAAAMLGAIALSHVANGDPPMAVSAGVEFAKLLLYYFLLVAVVDTPRRLERFLTALAVFSLAITALAVSHYHGWVQVPALQFLEEIDESGGEASAVRRLGSTGLFQDPNDMCLMLVLATTACLFQIVERRRWYWAAPVVVFGHALMLTRSRGGFLGLVAALVAWLASRYGRKALPLGLLVLPVVFAAFAGRQTSISLSSGTGLSRVQLWADGLYQFDHHPVFGIGTEHYADFAGHVAHNSFIHCFTELGLFGGTIFLGAFYLAFWPLVRLGGRGVPALTPELGRLRPYVLAAVTGYATGLMSLSCPYVIPTYTILGLSSVFTGLAEGELGVPVMRVNLPLVRRVAVLGVGFIVAAHVAVRVLLLRAG
jgi:O-antigen ligase